MGESVNITHHGVTTSETSVLDGAIRDNYPAVIGLGNLKDENFKMALVSQKMIQYS